jgi:cytoskeletal protein CcmA (bactofilin family)
MLFKKTGKSFLDKEIGSFEQTPSRIPATAFVSPLLTSASSEDLLSSKEEILPSSSEPDEVPDVYIGKGVFFQGELQFPNLLHIDGKFEGKIISAGRIIVGSEGHVKADLRLAEAFISGKVEGDIYVQERLVLRGRAEIYGNITAPVVSVDEGVTIVGQLCVSTKNNSS